MSHTHSPPLPPPPLPGATNPSIQALQKAHSELNHAESEHATLHAAVKAMQLMRVAEMGAFEAGREANEALASRHPAVSGCLSVFMSEVQSRFSPRQEERLLAVVNALLHRWVL